MDIYRDYYEYKIRIAGEGNDETLCGVTYGKDFSEALQNILHFYRHEEIFSLSVEMWDCNACIEMSKNVLDDLRNNI